MDRYPAFVDGADGTYGVVFPDLPGCVAMGHTVDEALKHAQDALSDYMCEMESNGWRIAAPSALESLELPEGNRLVSVPLIRRPSRQVPASFDPARSSARHQTVRNAIAILLAPYAGRIKPSHCQAGAAAARPATHSTPVSRNPASGSSPSGGPASPQRRFGSRPILGSGKYQTTDRPLCRAWHQSVRMVAATPLNLGMACFC